MWWLMIKDSTSKSNYQFLKHIGLEGALIYMNLTLSLYCLTLAISLIYLGLLLYNYWNREKPQIRFIKKLLASLRFLEHFLSLYLQLATQIYGLSILHSDQSQHMKNKPGPYQEYHKVCTLSLGIGITINMYQLLAVIVLICLDFKKN